MTQQHNYWRADITGLRALAVIPVVLYHAFPNLMPGGFVGVDIFFVISGYLISGIIFRSLINRGGVNYADFYAKRIRRILPNLILLLTFCLVIGYFFLFDDELKDLAKQVYSSAGFYQNFRLLGEVDYFAPAAERQPLLHLWSLAIEEQFYIVFPLLCGLIWRFTRSVRALGVLVGAVTLGSLALCLGIADQRFNFYFPLTRFWELGAGIVLSYLETFKIWSARNWSRSTRDVLSVVALVMLIGAFAAFDHETVFPGVASLLPVLGAVLLIASHEDAIVNRWLTVQPVVFIGLISYSLYLWHWPFLVFSEMLFPSLGGAKAMVLPFVFVLSIAAYRFVEVPFRQFGWRSCVCLLISVVLIIFCAQALKKVAEVEGVRPWMSAPVQKWQEQVRAAQYWNVGDSLKLGGNKVYLMSFGEIKERLDVLAVGDSHMQQNLLRLRSLAESRNKSFRALTSGGTLFSSKACDREKSIEVAREVERMIVDLRPRNVVVAQIWGRYNSNCELSVKDSSGKCVLLSEGGFEEVLWEWQNIVDKYQDVKFWFVLDAPWDDFSYDLRNRVDRVGFMSSYGVDVTKVEYPEDDRWLRGNELVEEFLSSRVTILKSTEFVCPEGRCNLLSYRDDDHLKQKYVLEHGVWLDPIFDGLK